MMALEQTRTSSAAPVEALRRHYVALGPSLRQTMARLAPDLDADDLLQELFVLALAKAPEFERAENPQAWLYGVAVRLTATRRRTARVRRFFGLDHAESTPAVDATSRTMEQRDAQRQVQRALASLSDAKREVFVLFELQGLAGEDIARALDIPLKTVWTRLFHARKEVTAAIERQLVTEARTTGLGREGVAP